MKKKIMMVAAILGALTLGSCVDDNESQSVTDVRNAKTEQLKAMANLANAQAEAELIIANAEKALKEAEAAYQKALADGVKQDAELAKARFEVEIEKIRAEAELAIINAKKAANEYDQQMLAQASERIQALYNQYHNCIDKVNEFRQDKFDAKIRLAELEGGLITAQEANEKSIAKWQKQLDLEEYKLSLFGEYANIDKTELQKKALQAQKDATLADKATDEKRQAYSDANTHYNYILFSVDANMNSATPEEYRLNLIKAVRAFIDINCAELLNFTYRKVFLDDTHIQSYLHYSLNPEQVAFYTERYKNNIKYYTDQIGDTATENSLVWHLAKVEKIKADSLAANPKFDTSALDQQIVLYNNKIAQTKDYLELANRNYADFESLIACFSGDDLKAYDAAIESLIDAHATAEAAEAEYVAAREAAVKLWEEYNTANTVLNNATDIERRITNINSNIEMYKGWIADAKNSTVDTENQIIKLKATIEFYESQIAEYEAYAEKFKKLLDEAIEAQN